MVWKYQLCSLNLFVQLLIVCSFEREAAAKECKQKDTCRINVCRRTTELNLLNDFRSHIRGCTTKQLHLLSVWNLSAETEVNQLYISVVIQHDIF